MTELKHYLITHINKIKIKIPTSQTSIYLPGGGPGGNRIGGAPNLKGIPGGGNVGLPGGGGGTPGGNIRGGGGIAVLNGGGLNITWTLCGGPE